MLTRKFGIQTFMLGSLVDCEDSRTPEIAQFRAPRFYRFISDILELFESTPELTSVKLTATANFDTDEQEDGTTVFRMFHELHLDTIGATFEHLEGDAGYMYLAETLPRAMMDRGTFEFRRDDQFVSMFLSLKNEQLDSYLSLLFLLGFKMANSFTKAHIQHRIN